jgi:endoglucanase
MQNQAMKGLRVAALVALFRSAWAQAGNCPGTFTSISAADFVSRVHPGWNLGNTLDAVPNEGSWNNAPVQASTFDTVKSAGFNSVRLPGEFHSVLHASTTAKPVADNI